MGKQRRSRCRNCGISGDVALISKRGLCDECGMRALIRNNVGLADPSSESYQRWLASWLAAAERLGHVPPGSEPDA